MPDHIPVSTVLRAIRRHQHRAAMLDHVATRLLYDLTTAAGTPPLVIASHNTIEDPDPHVVEELSAELAAQAERERALAQELSLRAPQDIRLEDVGAVEEQDVLLPACRVDQNPVCHLPKGRKDDHI